MRPSSVTSIETAAGTAGRPGIVVIEPQIITTISTTLTVDSIQDAADKLTAFATDHGGYVATMSMMVAMTILIMCGRT